MRLGASQPSTVGTCVRLSSGGLEQERSGWARCARAGASGGRLLPTCCSSDRGNGKGKRSEFSRARLTAHATPLWRLGATRRACADRRVALKGAGSGRAPDDCKIQLSFTRRFTFCRSPSPTLDHGGLGWYMSNAIASFALRRRCLRRRDGEGVRARSRPRATRAFTSA